VQPSFQTDPENLKIILQFHNRFWGSREIEC
jgi:hypothetical protein